MQNAQNGQSGQPQRLGKYELREPLGHGGMAQVWKAFDTQLQRYVAIKFLHANLRDDPNFVTRFQREAQLIASLRHPNIVQIHDFQITPSEEMQHNSAAPTAYMVMDYVEGQTLEGYIRQTSARGQIPPPPDILNLFTSISQAIDYAHLHGMIHRDIKPSNILLDAHNTTTNPMGEPILTDFGVARLLSVSSNALSGMLLGTPLYISPEQAQGQSGTERSDIYSLGVILYEMVTGVTPFRGNSPLDVMNQHVNMSPPSPVLLNPRIPPALTLVILRSLAKNPQDRFSSASSMTAALAEALNLPIPDSMTQSGHLSVAASLATQRSPQPTSPAQPGTINLAPPMMPARTPVQAAPFTPPSPLTTPMLMTTTPAVSPPTSATPITPPLLPQKRNRWYLALIAALLVLLLGGLASYLLLFQHGPLAANPIVGHAFFVSSGQLNPGTTQGIADQMKIDLQNVPDAPSGKSYFVWLLGDSHPTTSPDLLSPAPIQPPILLTNQLPIQHGVVHYLYPGDAKHNNLLAVGSRVLITLEDSNASTSAPTTERSTWRFYAELPQATIPLDPNGFSATVHIRHLFYNETGLELLGLPGGIDTWFTRNTEKTLEWAVSARDDWHGPQTTADETILMHALFTRILDYMDGSPNVHVDVPANTPLLTDPTISQVALLTVNPQVQGQPAYEKTNPPGYVDHIQYHISQVSKATDITPETRALTAQIITAVNNAKGWLLKAHSDAAQLFKLDNTQMMQPGAAALIDDLTTQITYAYIGQLDPTTNQIVPGVLQMHYEIQQLATFTLTSNIPQTI